MNQLGVSGFAEQRQIMFSVQSDSRLPLMILVNCDFTFRSTNLFHFNEHGEKPYFLQPEELQHAAGLPEISGKKLLLPIRSVQVHAMTLNEMQDFISFS